MLRTSARLLQVLTLLQRRRSWSGEQLAEKLEVTPRTVRNDIERLRDLGYPVRASPGIAGGYRLAAGAGLPPLLLDDDEAVAVALGLANVAASSITGIEETGLRALVKLEQVMPARVRQRLTAVQQAVVTLPRATPGPSVDAATLSILAAACDDHQRLRFDYRNHNGSSALRTIEPHRVVHDGRRWYLVAWDVDRSDWRTFRIDRMKLRMPAGPRFASRPPPSDDLIGYVSRGLGQATWQIRARVRVYTSAAELAQRVPAAVAIEALDNRTCLARIGSESLQMLALYLGMLGSDFDVIDPPALRDHLRVLGERYLRAAGSVSTGRRKRRTK